MPTTLEGRFWYYVVKTDGCWLWTGARDGGGYGFFSFGAVRHRATHVAWELAYGASFPLPLLACHRCDNPPCVRPDHLFLGTHSDNAKDAIKKGRLRPPETPKKTHCKRGHEFTADNSYVPPKRPQDRHCLTCRNERNAARYSGGPGSGFRSDLRRDMA